jgi:hypothetical protein
VKEDFLDPNRNILAQDPEDLDLFGALQYDNYTNNVREMATNGSLTKYSILDCRSAYAVEFATKVGEVLLVTSDKNISYIDSIYDRDDVAYPHDVREIPYYWTCGDGYSPQPSNGDGKVCTASIASSAVSRWTVNGHDIAYCMVEQTPESCKISFNATIMIFVLVANLAKCTIMVLTLWKLKAPTLVSVGDAISSFLQHPDKATIGTCLNTNQDFAKWSKGQT